MQDVSEKNLQSFLKKIIFIFLASFSFLSFNAQIKGKVKDAASGEELIGATVFIAGQNKLSDFAGLDGSFHIKHIPNGTYTICAQFIGYTLQEKQIEIKDSSSTQTVTFLLKPLNTMLEEVEVTGSYENGSDGQYC
jgi:hypothetical protein